MKRIKQLVCNSLLVFIISGLSVFTLTRCQSEEVAVEVQEHNHLNTHILTKQEAAVVAGKLQSLLGINKGKDKTLYETQAISTNYGTVDYSKVIVVEEENGDKNYAFGIIDTETTANKFSNLILREDGDYNSVQVARYTMTDAFANDYLNNTRTIGEFEGDLSLVTIMNDNPCPPPDDSTPAAGGPSGGTGGSTSSPSAGNYTGGTTNVGGAGSGGSGTGGGTMRITCNNCSRTYGSYGAWQGSICATYDITVVISFGFSDNDGTDPNPCNDPVILPLIEMSPNDIMLRNFFRNDLTQAQRLFLINNSTINTNVNQYLIANSINGVVNVEARAFVREAVERIRQNPTLFKNLTPFIIEKQIDDSQLPPCAKDIVAKIKNLQQNDFAAIIAKLGGATTPYGVKISPTATLNPGAAAETYASATSLYEYNIDINPSYLSTATDLSIATTILHELIHAYFLSLLADYAYTGNTSLQSFPNLWDLYVTNFNGDIPDELLNLEHHNAIAVNFVNTIARGLQEYKTGIPVNNSSQIQQLYKDLAWFGLHESNQYNDNSLLSPEDRIRIARVNNAELYNAPQNNGNGSPSSYLPQGTPCN
jgi:hypothetical protein